MTMSRRAGGCGPAIESRFLYSNVTPVPETLRKRCGVPISSGWAILPKMPDRHPPDQYRVRTSELDPAQEMHVSHPLNERSEIFMTRLSDRTGLSHLGISLARLPAGKESFALHVHTVQEEWIYVLSGAGYVRID